MSAVIALGLAGVFGALGVTPALAADGEGQVQVQTAEPTATEAATESTTETATEAADEATKEAAPEATPEVTPEPSATDDALIEVVPDIPAITWPMCEGDKYIPPTLKAPKNSEGITYEFEDYWYTYPFLVPINLHVYATLKEGYTWGADVPEGWRLSETGGAYDVRFEDVPCAPHNDPIVPELPVVTQAECVDGELTEPTVTVPESTEGVTYELREYDDGDPRVLAKTSWSYFFGKEAPEGWVISDPDVAWFDVTFDDVSCEPGAGQPEQSGSEPEQLAATGPGDAVVLGGVALLTVAAGVALIIARRRVAAR
ncbi:hypothetical protein [Promicromonospora sp. NPDC057488]|uniref:hypothetical protein n=1 Tax=Promicromonospora sp. NPDC057488 TaxID=3346147 RepID=UPI00366EA8E3